MPELSSAPADAAVTGTEQLLTLAFENLTVQQIAAFVRLSGQAGDASERPADPDLESGAIALWWSTDTSELSLWDGSTWQEDIAGGGGGSSNNVSIITEGSAFTVVPATHSGRNRWIQAASDVTFDSDETYSAGEVYNITATAGLDLIGDGVTLTPPSGGTLELAADMTVAVLMTSGTTGRVAGQTVPA